MKENGVEFLEVPDTYYDDLTERVGAIDEDIEVLKKLKILLSTSLCLVLDRKSMILSALELKREKKLASDNS